MNINEIDKFRNDFFDKLIKEEKEKEKAKIMAQKHCFHNYNLMGIINENGYQERTCSKCGHSALKSVQVWEGTKNGSCIIS
jgi:hypothetical protein